MHFQFNLCQMRFMLSRLNLTQREEWQFLIKLSSDINFLFFIIPLIFTLFAIFPLMPAIMQSTGIHGALASATTRLHDQQTS